MNPISRRELLRAGGLVLLGGIAAACGKGGGGRPRTGTLDEIIAGRRQGMQLIVPPFEILPGGPQRVAFGLQPVGGGLPFSGGGGSAWVARDRMSPANGPAPIAFRGDGLGDRGIYTTTLSVPEAGRWLLLVEASPDQANGETLIGAAEITVGKQNTKQPRAGDRAIVVPTPTLDDARGVDPICTRKPACSMHRVSLDDALRSGKPTVFIIATPAFCSSQLCGPEVDLLEEISKEFSGRVNFVHAEVLKDDDPETVQRFGPLSPAATAWHLESEPSTYFIDASGVIAERFVGPMDRTEARAATQALVA